MNVDEDLFDIFVHSLFGITGFLLTLSGLAYLYFTDASTLLAGLIAIGPGVTLLVGYYATARSNLPPERYKRVYLWVIVGAVGLVAVPIGMIVSPAITIDKPFLAVQAGLGLGAVSGFMVGYFQAQSIQKALHADRSRMRANRVAEEHERLEHLNHLLRHDILNNINIIQGYTEILLDDCEPGQQEELETIFQQAAATVKLIQNVRAYLDAVSKGEDDLKPINLSSALADEVTQIRSRYPEAVIETDLVENVTVQADPLLSSVFSNLLNNAVVHNNADHPEIDVSMMVTDTHATVEIADDGPGIPPSVREHLFDPSETGDHGFGLYLVRTLVERYQGSISLAETGDEGTRFKIELPLAESPRS